MRWPSFEMAQELASVRIGVGALLPMALVAMMLRIWTCVVGSGLETASMSPARLNDVCQSGYPLVPSGAIGPTTGSRPSLAAPADPARSVKLLGDTVSPMRLSMQTTTGAVS